MRDATHARKRKCHPGQGGICSAYQRSINRFSGTGLPRFFEPLEVTLLDHLQVSSKWLQRMTALVGVLLTEPLTEVNWL
jgi:hypothetical protein